MGSDPDLIKLRVGERHPVRLAGLGTAGYRWTPEMEGDTSVAEVSAGGVDEPDSDAVGASATELFTIRGLRPGRALVRFAQRRPWEAADRPAADEHVIELHVA